MKIAMLNPRPQRRGAELFARELATELRRRGHQLAELYLYPPPARGGLAAGPDDLHLAEHPGLLERTVGWDPALARSLRRTVDRLRPDILQVSGGSAVKYGALATGRRAETMLLVYRNIGQPDLWVRGWARRWLYRRHVFPRVTAVATVAEAFVPRLRELCPNAHVIRHIPTGVDQGRLAPTSDGERTRAGLDTPGDAPTVLFAGALSAEKRVDRLLRAFRKVVDETPGAHLWVAGDGPLAADLRELAERLAIADRVRFAGERSDIGDLIAASDLVALTSDTEGVPAILHEAAWLGRPAVATRVGATAEVVADGETGLLVSPDDEGGLARALGELLRDPERRSRMGAAAAARLRRDEFSIEALSSSYEALYAEGLSQLHKGVSP